MSQLTLHLLGAPGIARDGAPVAVDTRKATALLAYLAVTGRSHARETLAASLWPEYDDEHAWAALRRTLSTLRVALGVPHLTIDRDTVSLVPGAGFWVDVTEFRVRLAACRTHGHAASDVCHTCLAPLAEAAALYCDDFLTGFTLRDSAEFDDWQFTQAESLRAELAEALGKLAAGYSASGDFAAALAAALRWLALDPLREEAHRQVMRLQAWAGQRNAALHQYRSCVRILEQELGVAPLAETTDLYETIKGNRLLQPAELSGLPRPDSSQPAPGEDLTNFQRPARSLPLVGRAAELTLLVRAHERHPTGGYFVAVEGEAGIGKTRLAEEFLARVRAQGATIITVRCYEGEANVAYGPVADGLRGALAQSACADRLDALPAHWLAEAARLLPELSVLRPSLPPSLPLDAPSGQSRFFEGLRQVLSTICQGSASNVLFFDDMHWADAASLDLLAYLVRRLRGQPLFILATWRSNEGAAVSRLRGLVAEAQRADIGTALALKRLALADVLDMVRDLSAAGTALPDGIAGRLYHETEGLPLFLAAYLEALAQGSERGGAGAWPMPRGVVDLLRARLGRVEVAAQQTLQAAAVIGRSFDLGAVQMTSGRSDEEIISALEMLADRGIITEVAEDAGVTPRYDFTHEKLRALVYDETSLARRRLLHGRAATALAERVRRRREGDAPAGQIAQHYRLAGLEAEAAAYFVRAGDHARALYANTEALAHYRAALALGHPDTAALYEAIGDLQTLAGEYGTALDSLETAAALTPTGSLGLAGVEHKLAVLHGRCADWAGAENHFEAAIHGLNASHDRGAQARVYADWSLAAHQQGQVGRVADLAQVALEAAESAEDPVGLAQAHNILGILARNRGDLVEAVRHLTLSLASAETLANPSMRSAALNNLARVRGAGGEHKQAIAIAMEGLALCQRVGDRHREAALHNNLADLMHAGGRPEEAMAHLKKAVVIFAEIGMGAGDAQPEIWKLTEW